MEDCSKQWPHVFTWSQVMIGTPHGTELSRPTQRIGKQDRAVIGSERLQPRVAAATQAIPQVSLQRKSDYVDRSHARGQGDGKVQRASREAPQILEEVQRAPANAVNKTIHARE